MTRIPSLLGPDYDNAAQLPDGTDLYEPKRHLVLARLRRAEAAGEADIVELMNWELGLLDLTLAPADGVSPFQGGEYQPYAVFYHFTDDTARYARARGAETHDVILKLHYLEYVLLRMEPRGREWIDLQRELLTSYREYADGCRSAASEDRDGFAGLHIERALVAVGRLLRRPGVVRGTEAAGWAEWLVALAEDSRAFPSRDPEDTDQQRHRWVADYLEHLSNLPAEAASPDVRRRALQLLEEAAVYYEATPLNDDFERRVAQVEAALRKHWGEAGTHKRMVRRHFDAIHRRAQFHERTGNGFLTAHFYRQARRLVEEHRQYFAASDVARLERAEQAALSHAVEAGEFAEIRVPMVIPREMMDYTRETPEATVEALLEQIVRSVPNRAEIARHVQQTNAEAPLQALLGRTVIGPGKVVGESLGENGNQALDVEQRANVQARLLGAAVVTTAGNAAAAVELTAEHLIAPMAPLRLDEGTLELLKLAFERVIAKDFVSAMHILVPHTEDVLRQHLRAVGVDTTEFRRDVGDGTSRTDDATLGSLMRKSLPDGRSVRDYLGADLWDHLDSVLNSQTGLNLRNEFAHGLARPGHCAPENVGLALSLLYLLTDVAQRNAAALTLDEHG